jgi:hypothetical protein
MNFFWFAEAGKGKTAMLDTIFTISTFVFFVLSVLYVKFCSGMR